MKTMTQAQAAEYIGVTKPAIAKMLKRGALTEGPARVPTVVIDAKLRNEKNRRRNTGRVT